MRGAHSNLFAQPCEVLAGEKRLTVRCACNIELFIWMLRARPSFLLATEERRGTHYRRTESAIRRVHHSKPYTHPPPFAEHNPLCWAPLDRSLSLYCVLCVRNDAPCVFLAGGYFYRETTPREPLRIGPRSQTQSRWRRCRGRATLSLVVSSACVRRVLVVYFLWLLSNGGRFGGRRLMQLFAALCGSQTTRWSEINIFMSFHGIIGLFYSPRIAPLFTRIVNLVRF